MNDLSVGMFDCTAKTVNVVPKLNCVSVKIYADPIALYWEKTSYPLKINKFERMMRKISLIN